MSRFGVMAHLKKPTTRHFRMILNYKKEKSRKRQASSSKHKKKLDKSIIYDYIGDKHDKFGCPSGIYSWQTERDSGGA